MEENKRLATELAFWKENKHLHFEKIWAYDTPAGRARVARRLHYLVTLGAIAKGTHVLEIGCGEGTYTQPLAETDAHVVALELSAENIKKAQQKQIAHATFLVGNAEQTSFKDASFDAVVGVSILHHTDTEKTLREAYRCLKKGGRIVFSEPNLVNPYTFLTVKSKWMRRLHYNTNTETALITYIVRSQLRKIGFRNIAVRNFDFLYPLTPEFLVKPVTALSRVLEHVPLVKEFTGSIVISATK